MLADDCGTALVGGGDVVSTTVGDTDETVELAAGGDATVVAGETDGAEAVPLAAVDAVVAFTVDVVVAFTVDGGEVFTVDGEAFDALDEQLASVAATMKTVAAPRNRV